MVVSATVFYLTVLDFACVSLLNSICVAFRFDYHFSVFELFFHLCLF